MKSHENAGSVTRKITRITLKGCSNSMQSSSIFAYINDERQYNDTKRPAPLRSWSFYNFIFVVANDRYILPVFISFSCMQRCHSLHLLICQFKVEYADVFKDMIRILRTRYRNISCLQMPAKDYLS